MFIVSTGGGSTHFVNHTPAVWNVIIITKVFGDVFIFNLDG